MYLLLIVEVNVIYPTILLSSEFSVSRKAMYFGYFPFVAVSPWLHDTSVSLGIAQISPREAAQRNRKSSGLNHALTISSVP